MNRRQARRALLDRLLAPPAPEWASREGPPLDQACGWRENGRGDGGLPPTCGKQSVVFVRHESRNRDPHTEEAWQFAIQHGRTWTWCKEHDPWQ